mmetsp:Transcript_2913/g.6512  ORF Transcript_2913/g.6512 Transcript_2913/m.6512 type:complete len:127 (+) Transcript_2913:309-689(+)
MGEDDNDVPLSKDKRARATKAAAGGELDTTTHLAAKHVIVTKKFSVELYGNGDEKPLANNELEILLLPIRRGYRRQYQHYQVLAEETFSLRAKDGSPRWQRKRTEEEGELFLRTTTKSCNGKRRFE